MLTETRTTVSQIVADFEAYVRKGGGPYSAWYVGIARDPRDRLFNDHSVDEKGGWWIFRTAGSSDDAREVESYFLQRGTDGGSGGGDWRSTAVYAYRKTSHTNP